MGKWRRLINLRRYQLRTLRTVDVKARFYNSWLRISGFGMGRSKCTCYPSYSLREKNLLSIDRSSLPYLSRLVTLQIFKFLWWVHTVASYTWFRFGHPSIGLAEFYRTGP